MIRYGNLTKDYLPDRIANLVDTVTYTVTQDMTEPSVQKNNNY